jgi:hypothetical protein
LTLPRTQKSSVVDNVNFRGLGRVDFEDSAPGHLTRRGLDERSPNMIYMAVDSAADSVRADPRFQVLLREMNFPQ